MLNEINTSLVPIIEDFDRYCGWQHRRARLEEDLRKVEDRMAEIETQQQKQGLRWWEEWGWLGELLTELTHGESTSHSQYLLKQLEHLYRARRSLIQQIDHLDQQMEQVGDPSDLYEELITLKREYLLSQGHPQSVTLRHLAREIDQLEVYLSHLDEILRATQLAQQTLTTLVKITERGQAAALGGNLGRQPLLSSLRRSMQLRLRKILQLAESGFQRLAQALNALPDYETLPSEFQAGHFLQFQGRFQRLLVALEGPLGGRWQPILEYAWTTEDRIERLEAWLRTSHSAAEQRHSFLLRKQERIIREAE